VGISANSFRYGLNKLPNLSELDKTNYTKMEYQMMEKMESNQQINKLTTGSGDLDDISWRLLNQYIKSGKSSYTGAYIDEMRQVMAANTTFIDKLLNGGHGPKLNSLIQKFQNHSAPNSNGKTNKYYISNANTAGKAMGILQGEHFCPISSIMDAQSICSTSTSAYQMNGLEFGKMDVTIRNGELVRSASGGAQETMTYRIQVIPGNFKKTKDGAQIPMNAQIRVYLNVSGEELVNIGDLQGKGGEPPLEISLNGGESPLQAATCFREMAIYIMSLKRKYGTMAQILEFINTNSKEAKQVRQLIMNRSIRKGLGDFLQELNGVVDNGGYVAAPSPTESPLYNIKYNAKPETIAANGSQIVPPNEGRLTLSNDKPSGCRLLLFILYAKSGINPNCMGGFMNPQGAFGVAYRSGGAMTSPDSKTKKRRGGRGGRGGREKTRRKVNSRKY
jgi:hypothetical protein